MKFAVRIHPVTHNGQSCWEAQSEKFKGCQVTGGDPVSALLNFEQIEAKYIEQEVDQIPEANGKITLYTDGACSGNPGIGGWASIMIFEDGSELKFSGGCLHTTNNRMEMASVIEALQFLTIPHEVDIYTDSQYVVKTMTEGWKRNKNLDLWEGLDGLADKHVLRFHWVEGHSGNLYNERCDAMAKAEIVNLRKEASCQE